MGLSIRRLSDSWLLESRDTCWDPYNPEQIVEFGEFSSRPDPINRAWNAVIAKQPKQEKS